MQEDLRHIYLNGMARSFQNLIKSSIYSGIWRGISIEETGNPDQPFRLDYRPEKYCPSGSKRKKTCRQVLPKIEQLLTSDLEVKIRIFFDLIEFIKPHAFQGNGELKKQEVLENLCCLLNFKKNFHNNFINKIAFNDQFRMDKSRYLHRKLLIFA